MKLLKQSRLCTAAIKHIRLSYQGRDLCVNCADRVVRTIPIPQDPSFCTRQRRHSYDGSDDEDSGDDTLEVKHKFQDLVNHLQWNACAFSGNGDYVIGLFSRLNLYLL
jgi:COMPASS component SWD1